MTKLDRSIKISTVGKDDYPELEDNIVIITQRGKDIPCIVVGCNRSVGVTIVRAEDKNRYMLCFAGPVAPGGITPSFKKNLENHDKTYDEAFNYLIAMIKKGSWIAGDFISWVIDNENCGGGCSGSNCAYSQ